MSVYLVSYDLVWPSTIRDYTNLINAITSNYNWAKPLESCFFVETSKSPTQIYDGLISYLDPNDKLFIIEVSRNWKVSTTILDEVKKWMLSKIL